MKKINLFLAGARSSRKSIFIVGLAALVMQSCSMTERKLEASVDGNQQRYSGPSYPSSSGTQFEPGENIGLLVIAGLGAGESRAGSYNHRQSGTSNPLYASADKGPAAFLDLNGSKPVTKTPDIMNNLFVESGLELVNKRTSDGGATTGLGYLQVPIYALYQYKLNGDIGKVFGGLGPYLAYGIFGSVKYGGESMSAFGDNGLKRFDAGLGLTAGYEMPSSLSFRLGLDLGLANIQKNAFGDKAHNTTISLNVGYSLDKLIGMIK